MRIISGIAFPVRGGVALVDGLEVEEEEQLPPDGVVVAGLHVADDGDEEVREWLAVEDQRDGAPHRVRLGVGGTVAGLDLRFDLARH